MTSLKDKAKNLPNKPGVYFFKTNQDILYIGKAASLKKRVRSYFNSDSRKTQQLLNEAKDIEHQVTDSVLGALVLEANLIKKHWPKYNVKGKDNKSFAYIVIPKFSIKDIPAPFVTRGQYLKKYPGKNFHVFGPYRNYHTARQALKLLRKVFPYCTKPDSDRPCFHSQIGLCPGICSGKITRKEYKKIINNLVLFLKGKKKRVRKKLKKEHPKKIEVLNHLQDSVLIEREKIGENLAESIRRIEGYDISHFSGKGAYGSMVVFEEGGAKKEDYRVFKIKKAKEKDDVGAIKEVLTRRLKHREWDYPDLFLIDGGRGQVNGAYGIIEQNHLGTPVVGIAKGRNNKDKLVFKETKNEIKELIKGSKTILQKVRDEAHRFSKKFSKKKIEKIE